MCWVLGVAAGDHEGDEGGSEEHEDAGLYALELPVPAGGLVSDELAVSVSGEAGKELVRALEDERLARGRQVADADGDAVDGEVWAAGGMVARYLAARANDPPRDHPVGPGRQGCVVDERVDHGERGHVVRSEVVCDHNAHDYSSRGAWPASVPAPAGRAGPRQGAHRLVKRNVQALQPVPYRNLVPAG